MFIHKKSFIPVVLGMSVAWTTAAQDAKTVLNNAAKAMGVDDVASVQYSGSGVTYAFGQAFSPSSPWPKFNLKSYTRVDDYNAGASRQTVVRTQAENPPRGGGLQPVLGEQTLSQVIGYKQPWADQMEIWISPVGFLKAAQSNNAAVKPETVDGKKYNVVSFMAQGKYKVNGYIDDQNLIAKVDTWVDNPVLGDTLVEVSYAEYRDFGGFFGPLKFPTKIVEKQGGYPAMELTITEAKRNVIAGVHTPNPSDSGVVVDETLIAPGVYYFTGGTHHSVVVEFNDYLVVIEAPLDEARSAAVISEAKKLFLNKPIRYLINTHQHFDHSGGIRTYAAEGATILTYQTNKPYYEKVFARPRTLSPDKLAQSKKKATMVAVGEKKVLTDGTHVIELYHIQNSGHNDGMLIAYLPKEKVLVEADLYTAGPPNAATPNPVSPYTLSLVDNLGRLKLDYEIILGLHGRQATKADLMRAVGKSIS